MMNHRQKFGWLALFATAMGFLEAIVVVYMRELYYPEGFVFPMKLLPPDILTVEWVREFATLVMLATVGIIAGKNNLQRLFYALYAFGVWDIIYYVALKLFLGWPESVLTWDLLFLIPIPWLGPVLAPVICSVTMIMMAFFFIGRQENGTVVTVRWMHWAMIYGGAFVILYTFMIDYIRLIALSGVVSANGDPQADEKLLTLVTTFIPDHYNWIVFTAGEALIIIATLLVLNRPNKNT